MTGIITKGEKRLVVVSGRAHPELARDVILEPGVLLRGATRIGEGSRVGAYAILTDVEIPDGAVVAPFSQLDGDAPAGP